MKRSLPTLFRTVITLAVLLLGSVPFVANAAVNNLVVTGLRSNDYNSYVFPNDVLHFSFDVTDIGAFYVNIYFCQPTGSCYVRSTPFSTLVAGHASFDVNISDLATSTPISWGYSAITVFDSGGGYIAEYDIRSVYRGGTELLVLSRQDTQVETVGDLGFHAIVLFFISFIVTTWMFRQLMR